MKTILCESSLSRPPPPLPRDTFWGQSIGAPFNIPWTMAQKIKQEANTTSTDQRIAQLQSEVHQLRAILDEQSNQLAKQQKLMQLIQFSWLTFFFVVFNVVLLGLFLVIFMKDKG